ncbi:hypothetical protein FRC01_000374, partial [Tulasnella sp. 417]
MIQLHRWFQVGIPSQYYVITEEKLLKLGTVGECAKNLCHVHLLSRWKSEYLEGPEAAELGEGPGGYANAVQTEMSEVVWPTSLDEIYLK